MTTTRLIEIFILLVVVFCVLLAIYDERNK